MFSFSSRNSNVLLGILLVLGLALRLYRLDTYGIYFDEKSTLLISQGVVLEGFNQKDVFSKPYFTPAEFWKPKTFTDFIEANRRGDIGNSPAYYGVVWLWMEIFGRSDASLRMPSVIFSVLIIWLLFVFVRRHFRFLGDEESPRLALLSAAIATVEPFFVAYSHIARNYSMTFFTTLLATHLFLLIMERVRASRLVVRPAASTGLSLSALYLCYGLVFITAVLCHYLTVTVFLCHGLYALLYLRDSRAWITLAITGTVGLGLVSLWFVFGGGKYTFFTLNYQREFYRNIALTNPTGSPFGTILPATIPNIAKRAVPIFSDLFIFTNGLGAVLAGLRNSVLALGLGAGVTFIIHRYARVSQPPVWVYVAVPILLLLGLPIYTVEPLHLLVLSVAIPFIYLISQYVATQVKPKDHHAIVMLVLLTFVPTLFLLFTAWQSGHTFGITQRYSGFSFPYVCVLVSMGLLQLPKLRPWFSLPIAAVLTVQAVFIVLLLGNIYADTAPKYTYFDKARIANPYWSSAKQLEELYTPGDTILYPNQKRVIYSEKIDKTYSNVSLLDAQLVNVYLPEDAQYIQHIDPNEHDRIVLVKGNSGKKITIFDFKGMAYRYGQ
jgi:uncharacterized membrane protein